MAEWDPIGVRGSSGSAHVYDVFVGSVYLLLQMEEVGTDQIEAHLVEAATARLGIPGSPELVESSARVASKLMGLRPQFQLH